MTDKYFTKPSSSDWSALGSPERNENLRVAFGVDTSNGPSKHGQQRRDPPPTQSSSSQSRDNAPFAFVETPEKLDRSTTTSFSNATLLKMKTKAERVDEDIYTYERRLKKSITGRDAEHRNLQASNELSRKIAQEKQSKKAEKQTKKAEKQKKIDELMAELRELEVEDQESDKAFDALLDEKKAVAEHHQECYSHYCIEVNENKQLLERAKLEKQNIFQEFLGPLRQPSFDDELQDDFVQEMVLNPPPRANISGSRASSKRAPSGSGSVAPPPQFSYGTSGGRHLRNNNGSSNPQPKHAPPRSGSVAPPPQFSYGSPPEQFSYGSSGGHHFRNNIGPTYSSSTQASLTPLDKLLLTGSVQEVKDALGLRSFRDLDNHNMSELNRKFTGSKDQLKKNRNFRDPDVVLGTEKLTKSLSVWFLSTFETEEALPIRLPSVLRRVYIAAYYEIQVPDQYRCLLPGWATHQAGADFDENAKDFFLQQKFWKKYTFNSTY